VLSSAFISYPPRPNVFLTDGLDRDTAEVGLEDTEVVVIDITSQFCESFKVSVCFIEVLIFIPDDTKRSRSKQSSEFPSQSSLVISRPRALLSSAPQHIPRRDAIDTEDMSPESNLTACLGHLAYKQVRRPPAPDNISDSSRTECHRSTATLLNHHSEVRGLGQKQAEDSDVTKRDVGPLLGCVSCEVRWTVKKSAAHKWSHITTCARRKGINPSTLQRLIEKELLKIQHVKTNDKKMADRSDSADPVFQTYVESVVAEAQPRRKQRRTETAGTLQPVGQTRSAILDRAKALLGEAVPCDAPEPEHTQAFGRSKLATGHLQAEDFDPAVSHFSEECALTSRLALLRSMAQSPDAGCE
jgi:hypothetical protein